ncbi:signal transduction histidine kinase [Bacillus horti]|uniref:histidine kinase n=2 Tax=Caldalkalibacillus horti TaxID=77523 RepID=A0ABT9W024_9BACI|nr:signal transduction histidine kinase [Bacillus horti]
MKGIRARLVGSHLLVIGVAIFVLVSFLIFAVRHYYYDSIEQGITQRVRVSADFYESYLSGTPLATQADDLLTSYTENIHAQVQIIDQSGALLVDSLDPDRIAQLAELPDVAAALRGREQSWRGVLRTTGEPVLSFSVPLIADGQVVGVLRYVSSLSQTNQTLWSISIFLSLVGIIVIALSALVSLVLSNSITKPILTLIDSAEKLARGKLSERVTKDREDELGRLADTINHLASELQRNEVLQHRFISSVSHELRTPLTSIHGWTVLLLSSDFKNKEELVEGLRIINQETNRLSYLVEDLLDFSKLQSGQLSLRKELINVSELLKDLEAQMTPRAHRLGIRLIFSQLPAQLHLQADMNRLKQVLLNILDNAMKFTPEMGHIWVSAEVSEGNFSIKIKDDGQGILEEDLSFVKNRLYQGKGAQSGSGIGLAICDEIMRLHHGSLQIESEAGVGTQVTLSLPCSNTS